MPKRALVTGAAGFVGACLARRLLDDGVETHLAARPETDRWRLSDLDAPVHDVDITEPESTDRLVRETRPDWIFHLAAHGAYSTQRDFRRMLDVNLRGTMNLLGSASQRGVEAFVHTGSSSEYGYVDHPPREDEPAIPRSHYAVTKLAASLHARAFAREHQLPVTILRLYSVYGPFEEPTRLIPVLAVRGLGGELPPLVDPDVARDFVYVDDVTEAYLVVARTGTAAVPGTIYNVGSGRQTTIREAVEVARKELAISDVPSFGTMTNRDWDTTSWVANPKAIEGALGWRARTSFEAGFARFVTWLREDADRLQEYRRRS